MLKDKKQIYKEVRDRHYYSIRLMFGGASGLLLIMSLVILATGVSFTGVFKLSIYSMQKLNDGILFSVFYFFFMTIMLATVGLFMVKDEQISNAKIFCYGTFLFFFCVLPLLGEASLFYSLSSTTPDRIKELCDTDITRRPGMSREEEMLVNQRRRAMGPFVTGFILFAQQFDAHSENSLDQVMCTDMCPCLDSGELTDKDGQRVDAAYQYSQMRPEFLYRHGRKFSPADPKRLPFFRFTKDPKKGVKSYRDCVEMWQEKKRQDPSIDLNKKFNLEDDLPDFLLRRQQRQPDIKTELLDLLQLDMYQEIEDLYDCSGMCRPSLFYFGLSIDKGYPRQTCLMEFKEYLDNNSASYAGATNITGLLCLFIWFLHFGFYFRQKEEYEQNNTDMEMQYRDANVDEYRGHDEQQKAPGVEMQNQNDTQEGEEQVDFAEPPRNPNQPNKSNLEF